MADRSCTTKNVLSSGCREGGQARCISELVSSSSWDILLHRIGDLLMCYILRHSSIFLPVKKSDLFQVTGPRLNVVLQKPISASSMAKKSTTCVHERKMPLVLRVAWRRDSAKHIWRHLRQQFKFGALSSRYQYLEV
uniref:Telomerase reverse transcriptase n=1 Tax=Arundo donax TaxID=35708 RepID=A0A0A8YRM2_ARUDO